MLAVTAVNPWEMMTMSEQLNRSQQQIADCLEGMLVVDAGPGTGKTHTVVQRYINILAKPDVAARDVMLLTFTNNAAQEMEDRIRGRLNAEWGTDSALKGVADKARVMRVSTFDAFCLATVLDSPQSLSRFFGLQETLTRAAKTVEKESLNLMYFGSLLEQFLAKHAAEYPNAAAVAISYADDLYRVINKLMAQGIVPLRRGWFGGRDGKDLDGEPATVRKALGELIPTDVEPKNATRTIIKGTGDSLRADGYDPDSGEPFPERLLDVAANEDRTELKDLVHDVYYEFIRHSIADDRLTFGLTACFAFVILYDDDEARERLACRYLIIDEFQDTNSNQLMTAMMLLKEPNLCVVGDWKQGIYGFRYVSVDNLVHFGEQTAALRKFLNDDRVRIRYSLPEPQRLPLTENYRSSQQVIDAAYRSLYIAATKTEEVDEAELDRTVTRITSTRQEIGNDTAVECVRCLSKDDELDEILRTVEAYVHSDFLIHGTKSREGQTWHPQYRDIAVLCRNTGMCRALFDRANECGIPPYLQGDAEVMRTREGKLALAWLKYVNNDSDPWGLVPILADRGYPLEDIELMVRPPKSADRMTVPADILAQRKALRQKRRRITDLLSSIFAFYGLNNDITQAIITVLSSSHRSALLTISDLINLIETDIAEDTKYEIDGLPDKNAITIQTIHSSKGLEYPIVIVAGLDQGVLPDTQGDKHVYSIEQPAGLRCKQTVIRFGSHEQAIVKSWRTSAIQKALPPSRDEEKRLLFVAISRAMQYVTLIAGAKPSPFYQWYAAHGYPERPAGTGAVHCDRLAELNQTVPKPTVAEFQRRRANIGVHDILDFGAQAPVAGTGDEVSSGGMDYGTQVHGLAQLMAEGYAPTEKEQTAFPQLAAVAAALTEIRARNPDLLLPEIECSLPFNGLNATLRGIIDLLAVFPDHVEIHDWKTDRERTFESEYRIQLSVYAHAAAGFYHLPVHCRLQWLTRGETTDFDAVPLETIEERVKQHLDDTAD